MANKYYYTACLKKDDNSGIIKDKRNEYNEALKDLVELNNDYNYRILNNTITFIGIIKHKANENPFDRIRDLNENLTLDVYTRIVNAMDKLRKKDEKYISIEGISGGISKDYMCSKRVRYNYNIAFEIEAYYDGDSFALFEFQIYLKRKDKYEDCCTLPSYFGEQQEKDLRKFINMYID